MSVLNEIKNEIAKEINKGLNEKNVTASHLVYPPDTKMGDFSFPCFDLSKNLKKNPVEIARELALKIKKNEIIEEARAAGPYLNFKINREYLIKNVIPQVLKGKEKYGKTEEKKGMKIMVEFAHPNPFKAFHIGHLRNIILGESIVRILESAGAKVIRTNYQGDVGMHIAKCLWAFRKIDKEDYPQNTDEKVALIGKCYVAGASAFESSEEEKDEIKEINKKIYDKTDREINRLWELGKKWSLDKFHEIYARVYSHFDREYMESEMIDICQKHIDRAIEKGILEKSDGAIVFKGEKYGLDTRVFLNSEGLPTYEGKELGLAFREFNDFGKLDLCIHNVAVEQKSFFKVTFKVEELLDEKLFKNKQYHNAYEFVGLKKGKMSSRKGEVVLGNDIINEAKVRIMDLIKDREGIGNPDDTAEKIAVAAIKYSFLKVSAFKYLAFDMAESVNFEGDSGPYLQYSYVRILSILHKAGESARKIKKAKLGNLKEEKEFEIVFKISQFHETIKKAGSNYDPSEICKYLFELTRLFNDYYHSSNIIKAEKEIMLSRLALILAVKRVIENGLYLLGIKTVEKM